MFQVKVCGITRVDDALTAAKLGFRALGFIMAESPRRIAVEEVRSMERYLPPFLVRVGVFVDEDLGHMLEVAKYSSLHLLQLHGKETPKMCRLLRREGFGVIKAIPLKDEESLQSIPMYLKEGVLAILVDTYHPEKAGGTGEVSSWELAREAQRLSRGRVILAGGLGPHNLMEAIKTVSPMAIDINSGVEIYPGKKDPEKMRASMNQIERLKREGVIE